MRSPQVEAVVAPKPESCEYPKQRPRCPAPLPRLRGTRASEVAFPPKQTCNPEESIEEGAFSRWKSDKSNGLGPSVITGHVRRDPLGGRDNGFCGIPAQPCSIQNPMNFLRLQAAKQFSERKIGSRRCRPNRFLSGQGFPKAEIPLDLCCFSRYSSKPTFP